MCLICDAWRSRAWNVPLMLMFIRQPWARRVMRTPAPMTNATAELAAAFQGLDRSSRSMPWCSRIVIDQQGALGLCAWTAVQLRRAAGNPLWAERLWRAALPEYYEVSMCSRQAETGGAWQCHKTVTAVAAAKARAAARATATASTATWSACSSSAPARRGRGRG